MRRYKTIAGKLPEKTAQETKHRAENTVRNEAGYHSFLYHRESSGADIRQLLGMIDFQHPNHKIKQLPLGACELLMSVVNDG